MKVIRLAIIFAFASCQFLQPKELTTEVVIARVGEEVLTETDIAALISNSVSPSDSAARIRRFVDEWVKKQLLIKKAEDQINFDEASIKNKVLDYQYALIVHEYEQSYIKKNLVDDITEGEITSYYEEKSENFILRENLAKCVYIKFPKDVPNLWKFKQFFKTYPKKDSADFWDYANQFSEKTFSDQDTWVKFEEIMRETPLYDVNDKTTFLKINSSIKVSDKTHTYFVKILDKRLVGEIAPLEYIEESIKEIIINKRKIALKKRLEKSIYDEAVANEAFEIYTN